MKCCRTSIALAAMLWLLGASPVHAQGAPFHIPVYTGTPLMISIGAVTQQTLNRQISATQSAGAERSGQPSSRSQAAPSGGETRSTMLVRTTDAGMAARMAAKFPAEARPEVEHLYRRLLDQHPQLMQRLGVPANDVAAAVATFLAGSYMAYRGVDFPDRHFQPLYRQVRQIIGSDPSFARATEVERREVYEEMAILGVHLALTREALKQRPDAKLAADVKLAAKSYLQQFMKVDAERVGITDQGLIVN